MTSVTFGDNSKLTSIGNYAFGYCYSLTRITIPSSVTSIGDYAFDYCVNLASVTFGANSQLTSIAEFAFYNCNGLTRITIPSSVTSIGENAFENCYNLSIYCEAIAKPSGWDSSWSGNTVSVYWYSEQQPTTEGNYWHYVDGVVTVWPAVG